MKSQIKKIIFKSLLFLIIFIFIDICFGLVASTMFFSQKSGKYYRITQSLKDQKTQLLIMGSSHANRHFVPIVFDSILGVNCYNAGVQGQKLIFHTALQNAILSRYKPELIILNVDPFWLYQDQEAYDRLLDLYPYYSLGKNEFDQYINFNNKYNKFKLLINSYRYNSTLAHIIKYWFIPQIDYSGYRPLNGVFTCDTITVRKKKSDGYNRAIMDVNFEFCFNNFIAQAKKHHVKIVFTVSPTPFGLNDNTSMLRMKEIANQKGVLFLDYSNDKRFFHHCKLFNDVGHLNHQGALRFSKIVARRLLSELK